jgi:hypothetical protein
VKPTRSQQSCPQLRLCSEASLCLEDRSEGAVRIDALAGTASFGLGLAVSVMNECQSVSVSYAFTANGY